MKLHTCTVCGRTKEVVIEWVCKTHTVVVKPDGSIGCIYCDEAIETQSAGVMIYAENAVSGKNTVTVDIHVKATTPFTSTRFSLDAPEGFEFLKCEPKLAESNFTLISQDKTSLSYEFVIKNLNGQDDVIDAVVATVTFGVDDSVATDNYAISVTHFETLNLEGEEVNGAAIGAMAVYKKIVNGDATGDEIVTLIDVLRILKYVVVENVEINLLSADCNDDGSITVVDVLAVLRSLLNK